MFEDKLIAALDPNGFRPLSIGKMANGAVVVSSETCAFEVIGAEWIRDVNPGEIVIIDDNGIQYDTIQTILNWLFVPWSISILPVLTPISKGSTSIRLVRDGAQLAREFKHEADIVVGVPNSSLQCSYGLCGRIWFCQMKWV